MKRLISSLVLLGVCIASSAQSSTPSTQVEKSKSRPVASPNRTTAAALAHWTKANRKYSHHHHHWSQNLPSAITWVDSTGKTTGRLVDGAYMLVPYKGELATLLGLEGDYECTNGCIDGGGAYWTLNIGAAYITENCAGPVYLLDHHSAQASYLGIPVFKDSMTYIYITRTADYAPVFLKSFMLLDGCYPTDPTVPRLAAPVIAVEPATLFGMAPFYLK